MDIACPLPDPGDRDGGAWAEGFNQFWGNHSMLHARFANSHFMTTMKLVPLSKYIQLALSHAVYSQNEDGSWTVEVPPLPGCVT